MALTEYESSLCPGCGHPKAESMDPESDQEWRSPPPARCHACTAIGHRAEQWNKLPNVPVPGALMYHSVRHRKPPRD